MFHSFPWVMNGWWTDVWSQPRRWVTVSPCFLLLELWFWGNCSKCGRIGWKCSQEWRGDHAGAFRHGWPWSSEWQPYTQQGVGALKPLPAHAVPVMLFGGWRNEAFLLHFWWVGKRSMEVVLFIWSSTDTFFFFLSKQVNYFSHNSSYKFSPNSFWLPIAAIFLSWFLPYSPVFPLPFQIPLTPTTAQLLSIPICFLQRILSSQNFDCFYLRTVFTDLVLS